MSRALGDGHLKQWIIAEPETKIIRIKPEYEFLILASDGLWDKVLSWKPFLSVNYFLHASYPYNRIVSRSINLNKIFLPLVSGQ